MTKTISKATSYSASSPVQPAFTQLSYTTWGKNYIKQREFEEQICFGLWHSLGGWHEDEVVIRWYQQHDGLKLGVSETCNQTYQQLIHPELFEILQDEATSPEIVRLKLVELGYRNISIEQ